MYVLVAYMWNIGEMLKVCLKQRIYVFLGMYDGLRVGNLKVIRLTYRYSLELKYQ